MEATLSNSTRKLLWFEITKMLIAALKNKCIVLFNIIFGTLSFPMAIDHAGLSSRVVSASDCGVRGPSFESRR